MRRNMNGDDQITTRTARRAHSAFAAYRQFRSAGNARRNANFDRLAFKPERPRSAQHRRGEVDGLRRGRVSAWLRRIVFFVAFESTEATSARTAWSAAPEHRSKDIFESGRINVLP